MEELDNAIAQFVSERGEDSTLVTFLEEMALVNDVDSLDQEQNSVTMMTLHISKGLEYPYVFIVGLEENLFPSARSTDPNGEDEVEEERRLAHVGMTRARKKLWLTYTKMRRVWGQEQFNPPSRFLKEIPTKYVQFKSSSEGLRFATRYGAGGNGGYLDRNKMREESFSDVQDFPAYESEGSKADTTAGRRRVSDVDYDRYSNRTRRKRNTDRPRKERIQRKGQKCEACRPQRRSGRSDIEGSGRKLRHSVLKPYE